MTNLVAGIDGCKGGWVAVEADSGGQIVGTRYVESVRDYLMGPDAPAIVAIDIPIGLTDTGPRKCDPLVRAAIKPRGSSVFPAPIRAALAARTRAEADAISRQIQGKGVGAQGFGIYDKIREVDTMLCDHPELRDRVFEIHPELCFAAMATGGSVPFAPMRYPKRTGLGFVERLALTEAAFGQGSFDQARATQPRSKIADDDILDAFAATWIALRVQSGKAKAIPPTVELDSVGLRMAMWY